MSSFLQNSGNILLDFDGSASCFELAFCFVSFGLRHVLFDGLGSSINEALGLSQAETGDFAKYRQLSLEFNI